MASSWLLKLPTGAMVERTAAAGYAMQAGGSAAVRSTMAPVGSFKSHEDAMLGIARQVPGARGAGGELTEVYRAIQQQVRELSHEVPLATTQIAEMFTAAARMEVPTDQLKEFTRTASMMATAFDAIPDEITEAMGKVSKNFKMPITQITGLADSINYLDDNAISKGGDIIDFLNRVSGTASTVAMSAKDAAALGSTLLTLGERTETAGAATNAMLTKFAAATKGTKKFRSALSEIGIDAQALEKGMSTDATKTLLQVIDAIRSLPKDKQLGVMAELVGLEHSDTLAKLADKAGELRRQLQLSNSSAGAGSMAREADARNQTLSAQQQMFENRMFNLRSAVGETLKPAIEELLKLVNPLVERFTTWVQENPALVSGLMQTALVIGALIAATGAILIPLALIAGKVLLMRFLFANLFGTGMLGMLKAFTGAILGLGRGLMLLMLNPLGLVVVAVIAAVAAIAGAGYLIYKNWDAIVAWLSRLSTRFAQVGGDMMRGLVSGITGALGWVKTAIGQVADNTIGWFKEKLGIRSPSRVFMLAGANVSQGAALGISSGYSQVRRAAAGLTAAAASAPLLANAQPLRIDNRPALSARAAAAPAAAPRGGDHFHLHLPPGMDAQAIARAVSAELDRRDRAQAAKRRSSLSDVD
ncbi:MAG: phage tail tape measure protein [Rubrivivax sp.]|nr:MAG: phage tail tape measure protein [Rubrivivax sp.]